MRPRVSYCLNKWIWMGIDLLYPPRCPGCNMIGYRLCSSCIEKISKVTPPFCRSCGRKVTRGDVCIHCQNNPPAITEVRSWSNYDEIVQKALQQLKYHRNLALGETFSDYLCELVINAGWVIDVITPIPLGRARQKMRGYNQAALLAKPVSYKLDILYEPKIVYRSRETLSQVNLSLNERRSNVAGAFQANGNLASGKRVLLVDDITTSGSTLNACAQALIIAGAMRVYGVTVARAG